MTEKQKASGVTKINKKMYTIQAMPIANSQSLLLNNMSQSTYQHLVQQLAVEWLLPPQDTCLCYDIIGRQLSKRHRAPPTTSTANAFGFERLYNQLARIDAHLFTSIVCSVAVDRRSALSSDACRCRQCGTHCADSDTPLLFALHCVALEGSRRFFNGMVDYVCATCAKASCTAELAKERHLLEQRRRDVPDAGPRPAFTQAFVNWARTLAQVERISHDKTRKLVSPDDFERLLYLLSRNVGYQIGNMQQFVDLFIQEQFAAKQIERFCDVSTGAPIVDTHESVTVDGAKQRYCAAQVPGDVQPFLHCIVCKSGALAPSAALGVLSTVYYGTARIFAAPYFVCDACQNTWQAPSFASQRFSRLLLLHRDSIRHCFKQSLQSFLCVMPRLLGLKYVDFENSSADKWSRVCHEMFARDATLFQPPQSPTRNGRASASGRASGRDRSADNASGCSNDSDNSNNSNDSENTTPDCKGNDDTDCTCNGSGTCDDDATGDSNDSRSDSNDDAQGDDNDDAQGDGNDDAQGDERSAALRALRNALDDTDSTLVNTVENDMLNKLFGLSRDEERCRTSCAALIELQDDPCIAQLDAACIKKCLCSQCVVKNLAFIEVLRRYRSAQVQNDAQSLSALETCAAQFSKLLGANGHCCLQRTRGRDRSPERKCSRASASAATSCAVQESERQFSQWQLPRKPLARNALPKCTDQYASTLLVNNELESVYSTSSHFMSPLF